MARSDARGAAVMRCSSCIGLHCIGLACIGLACIGLAGCTELAPGGDTLPQDSSALQSGAAGPAAPDPKWGCLGKATPPSAVTLRPSIALDLRITDLATQQVPAQLSVRACNRADVGCATPVQAPASVAEDGQVHLSLEQGFNGFLEITGPASVSTLFFVTPPLQSARQEALNVASPAGLGALASSGGLSVDPESGHLLVRAFDCQGELTGGVEFSNDQGGEPFAFVDGLPNKGYDVTTPDGRGGFLNVPPGVVVLQGREVASGQGSGSASVAVRKGWFTYGDLTPVQ